MGLIDTLADVGFDRTLAELDSHGRSKAKMARHRDTRPEVEWDELVRSPEQFEEYQSWQARPVFHGIEYLVSFIGDGPGRARFWGVYQVLGSTEIPYEELPEQSLWPFKEVPHYRYELKRVPVFDSLNGLVIEWNNEIVWPQYLRNNVVLERPRISNEEVVAVIVKVDFGTKSGVNVESYLDELRQGEWKQWNTPRRYKGLDGTGRKLLLYDKNRRGLTLEVEIESVQQTNEETEYPWSNRFSPDTLKVFGPPIPVEHIRTIPGLESFGVHRKDRNSHRNLTGPQYRALFPPLTDVVVKASLFRGGGSGESDAHKALKHFVLTHPLTVGLPEGTEGKTEYNLPSGDTLDVSFKAAGLWVAVEVKSAISPEGDIARGIFQCVKYLAVMDAQLTAESRTVGIRAVLVLAGRLTPKLVELKNRLGVEVIEGVAPQA